MTMDRESLDIPHARFRLACLLVDQRKERGGVGILGRRLSLHKLDLLRLGLCDGFINFHALNNLLCNTLLIAIVGVAIFVDFATIGCQMSVVNCREHRDWSSGPNVLERVFEDELLKSFMIAFILIQDAMIVHRSSSALDGNMRATVPVKVGRISASGLDNGARKGISVLVTIGTLTTIREEANMMALSTDNDGEEGLVILIVCALLQGVADVTNFAIDDLVHHLIGHTIAKIKNALRDPTAIGRDPKLHHLLDERLHN
jgi:hypothetical protein